MAEAAPQLSDLEFVVAFYFGVGGKAKGEDGVLVLTAFPPSEGGKPEVFRSGDPAKVIEAVRRFTKWGWQVYFSPTIMRSRMPKGKRGTLKDIVAVLGVVLDDDPSDGKAVILPEGLTPTLEIITSVHAGLPHRHLHFVFTKPVAPNVAAKIAEALHARCGGDHGGKDIAHIWRLPETPYTPDRKKVERGRSPDVQTVRLGPCSDPFDPDALMAALGVTVEPEAEPEQPHKGRSQGNREGERQAAINRLPPWLRDKIEQESNGVDRSTHTFSVLLNMMQRSLSDDEIRLIADGAPFAAKFAERGDLDAEITRARAKWKKRGSTKSGFKYDKAGKIIADSQDNIREALRLLGVSVRHNAFTDQSLIEGMDGVGPILDDRGLVRCRLTIDEKFYLRPTKAFFKDVICDLARRHSFHPVRDYLNGLEWDGKPRLDSWLIDYAGAADTPYTRAVGGLTLKAAVRRVRSPGVKFDEMTILFGDQGIGKSTLWRILAVHDEWFSDDLPLGVDGKRVIEQTRGHWLLEASDLRGLRMSDIETLKAFLSRQVDEARMSYDELRTDAPRHFIVVGSTNSEEVLKDPTGNRRFWPIAVAVTGPLKLDKLMKDRDQLWAEAAAREATGESIRLDPALYGAAKEVQEAHRSRHPFEDVLAEVLGDRVGKIPASDIWEILDIPIKHRTQAQKDSMGAAMRVLGWRRPKGGSRRFAGKMMSAYVRGTDAEAERPIRASRADSADGGGLLISETDEPPDLNPDAENVFHKA